uniref:Nuclear matrix constituent protein 1-like protein n=1 Tax=Kalanchoe fedtschenkoi TaxID=63787 RepID=A0A7N0UUR1_KALFE
MFTPQRKVWSGWLTPKSGDSQNKGNPSGSNAGYVDRGLSNGAPSEPMTPPFDSNKVGEILVGEERAPADVVARLDRELLEYQYNMGLLLIEKQEWSSKLEDLSQALVEAKDALKREQSAYFIAVSDVEKREENLRKALGVEKQCVHDLEKALHEMRSEYAEIKFTSDSKLAEANALVSSVEEKSLEVEAKLHAADAKLAEVSRKNAEIERKLLEAEAREDSLRKEYISFSNEREAHEQTLSKRKEDLKDWESKLHAGEERLSEGRRILNQREERANEKDKILKQKELDLIETQKKLDGAKVALKAEEEDIMRRLVDLSSREKELHAVRYSLERKESDLLAFDEKLNHREKARIQELTEEHNRLLDAKRREFELEIEQKRQSIDEDLKSKIAEVEKKEAAVNHVEEKLAKKEQAVEKRLEKLKEKEKEYESKFKALKDKEKSLNLEEKNVEKERAELLACKAELQSEKDELEQVKAEVQEQQLKICGEIEKLNVTEEERSEFIHLQAELKHEIDQCRLHKQLLLKESEDLRQQREIFERDWEELDKKKSEIEAEMRIFDDQKQKIEKLQYSEEEKLRKEKLDTEEYVRKEFAALEIAKESFAASMEHDKLAAMERIKNERSQMLRDFELRQQEIENNIQRRQEEIENELHEKEKSFEEYKDSELKNLNYLKELATQEMKALKLETIRLDKEKQEVSENKKNLEINQLELRKDIDELVSLSKKMKTQREQFVIERQRFIGFVEKNRNCETCGVITREFVLSDLQAMPEGLIASELAGQYLKDGSKKTNVEDAPVGVSASPDSGGTVSWLRKCTSKILRLSPIKFVEPIAQDPEGAADSTNHGNKSGFLKKVDALAEVEGTNSSAKHQIDAEEPEDDNRTKNTEQVLPENSQQSTQNVTRKPGTRRRPKISRTRSVKAVVEDAKNFIGEDFEYSDKNTEDSSLMVSESRGESSLADEIPSRNGRKRNRKLTSQTSGMEVNDDEESEGHSNSFSNRRRKRQQKGAPTMQTPGRNRYNLRRPRIEAENGRGEGGHLKNKMKSRDEIVSSLGSIRDDGQSTPNIQFETGADAREDVVEATVLSEEVNRSAGGADHSMQDEFGSVTPRDSLVDEGSGGGGDEDEEESEHPGQVSIGKKLWTFFTT